jgi:hypothetical protein
LAQDLIAREILKVTPSRDHTSTFSDKLMYKRQCGRCLNSFQQFQGTAPQDAVHLSVTLLNTVLQLFVEFQSLISRFGGEALANVFSSTAFNAFHEQTLALQSVSLDPLSDLQRLVFFLNISNTLVLHSSIVNHKNLPSWSILPTRIAAWNETSYVIGGHKYSLAIMQHAMIRAKLKPPEGPLVAKVYRALSQVHLPMHPSTPNPLDAVDDCSLAQRRSTMQVPHRIATGAGCIRPVLLHRIVSARFGVHHRQRCRATAGQRTGLLPGSCSGVPAFGSKEGIGLVVGGGAELVPASA